MSSSAAQNIYDTEDFFHNYAQLPCTTSPTLTPS